jgi:hypothetical protein
MEADRAIRQRGAISGWKSLTFPVHGPAGPDPALAAGALCLYVKRAERRLRAGHLSGILRFYG